MIQTLELLRSAAPARRQDADSNPAEPGGQTEEDGSPAEAPRKRSWWRFLLPLFNAVKEDLFALAVATIFAVVRAMGITIRSGTTGLRFTFGRATKELHEGFHPLFPGVQQVRVLPTRSRSMDLPSQRVVNNEGLVYHADANLVYRVVDVRRALIEIDDLEQGMLQMLTLGVQEVLRATDRRTITETEALSKALTENLERRLEPWGVAVERAGFPSIGPSPRTMRITQLAQNTTERSTQHERMRDAGLPSGLAAALVGTRAMPRSRVARATAREYLARRVRKLHKFLGSRGWTAIQIKQAELSLLSATPTRRRRVARR